MKQPTYRPGWRWFAKLSGRSKPKARQRSRGEVAGGDQTIGEEKPERLFLAFEFRQAHMLQMNLGGAFLALRPKLRRTPQFGEHGDIDRR